MEGLIHSRLDSVLYFLDDNRDQYYSIDVLLKHLDLPTDKQNMISVVENLEKYGYIEVQENRYELPKIKISQPGIEFITRTNFTESHHVMDMPLSWGISGTTGKFGGNENDDDSKEYLQLQINLIKKQLKDYPEIKLKAKYHLWIGIAMTIITALTLILK